MAGECVITIVGNLVDEPELRFTPQGVAVAKFRVASTPRTFNKQTSAWEDGESLFLTCSVWRQAAEHVAESLAKGMRVIVQGRLKQRSYEDREGVKRTVFELDVDEVGPSLRNATAKVTKMSGGRQDPVREARQAQSAASVQDPWDASTPGTRGGQPPGQGGGQAGGSAWADDPPF
jgi:single-strand DNA-binding protein